MAKTVFVDGDKALGILGSIIPAAWLNKIFSHRHDGLDVDGSAPLNYATTAGDGTAYTAALAPALTAHIEGMPVIVKFHAANTATNPNINFNALGGVLIQRKNSVSLKIGDIPAGYIGVLVYNGSSYDLTNPYLPTNNFGALITSYVKNTVYQAATDLTVMAMISGADAAEMHGYLGEANPPTSEVQKEKIDGAAANMASFTMVVAKGEYWKVSEVYSATQPTIVISVRPRL